MINFIFCVFYQIKINKIFKKTERNQVRFRTSGNRKDCLVSQDIVLSPAGNLGGDVSERFFPTTGFHSLWKKQKVKTDRSLK